MHVLSTNVLCFTLNLDLLRSNHPSKVIPIDMLFVLLLRLYKLKAQPKIFQFLHRIALNAVMKHI